MENIKYIKEITQSMKRNSMEIGNCICFKLDNGNIIKAYCFSHGIHVDVVNKVDGKVDCIDLPFKNYFKPTRCSQGAPLWYQHLDGGKWYFSGIYNHVLPTKKDYENISVALETYIKMFE